MLLCFSAEHIHTLLAISHGSVLLAGEAVCNVFMQGLTKNYLNEKSQPPHTKSLNAFSHYMVSTCLHRRYRYLSSSLTQSTDLIPASSAPTGTRLQIWQFTAMEIHFKALATAYTLLLCSLQSTAAESDLKRILMRATNDLLAAHGTSVTPHALASGFCFSREDRGHNKDRCADQPARKSAPAVFLLIFWLIGWSAESADNSKFRIVNTNADMWKGAY